MLLTGGGFFLEWVFHWSGFSLDLDHPLGYCGVMESGTPCTVVTENLFVREARQFWDDKDLDDFVNYIARNPLEGDEIQGTSGLRKIRWSRPGTGKRGGVRVIYYFYNEKFPIYLLTLYAKSEQEDLSPDHKKSLTKLAQILKSKFKE